MGSCVRAVGRESWQISRGLVNSHRKYVRIIKQLKKKNTKEVIFLARSPWKCILPFKKYTKPYLQLLSHKQARPNSVFWAYSCVVYATDGKKLKTVAPKCWSKWTKMLWAVVVQTKKNLILKLAIWYKLLTIYFFLVIKTKYFFHLRSLIFLGWLVLVKQLKEAVAWSLSACA